MLAWRRAVGVVKGRLDGWIHDCRLAIVVSADPARNVSGVREEAADARSGGGIPLRQVPEDRSIDPATGKRADPVRPEVGVELVPRIAHRRVAVANMPGPAGY